LNAEVTNKTMVIEQSESISTVIQMHYSNIAEQFSAYESIIH